MTEKFLAWMSSGKGACSSVNAKRVPVGLSVSRLSLCESGKKLMIYSRGVKTHFHRGPHQPRSCLQRADCNVRTV